MQHSVKFSDNLVQSENGGKNDRHRHNNNNKWHLPHFPRFSYRFIPDLVAWFFAIYGYTLGKWPVPFLIIGLLTGLAATAGIYRIRLATDSNNLIDQFLENDSRYVIDDNIVRQWMNNESVRLQQKLRQQNNYIQTTMIIDRKKRETSTNYYCDYSTYASTWRSQNIIVVSKTGHIFSEQIFSEILDLNEQLRDILACSQDDFMPSEERTFCCDSWDLQRLQAELSKAGSSSSSVVGSKELADFFSTLTYPADKRFPMSPALFANFFGGVTTNDPDNAYNAKVVTAKAMLFQYMLPNVEHSLRLEQKLTNKLKTLRNSYKTFNIYWQTWKQLEDEFIMEVFKEVPKVGATFICVILWCMTGALHTDALNSKPWCGLLGIGCTAFSVLSGFGAQFWLGDQFYTYLIAVPLMALGIGLDDMFILLGNWHRSDIRLPREERAMLTLQEGGTSIFVTALMTIIDFVIGAYTPYPAINTYSNFALWCLSFDFWLQMTVFMSVLVLTDSCEKKNMHSCCCCLKIPARSHNDIIKQYACTVICCTHGSAEESYEQQNTADSTSSQQQPSPTASAELIYQNIILPSADISSTETNSKGSASKMVKSQDSSKLLKQEKPTLSERFIYNFLAPIILHPVSRMIIAVALIGFLAGSLVIIWTRIHVGFRQEHLANRLSNTYDFSIYSWLYFRDYESSQQLEIVFNFTTAPFDRNFTKIHGHVVEVVERLEQSNNFVWDRRLNHVPMRDIHFNDASELTLDEAIYKIAERESSDMYKPVLIGDDFDMERLVFLATFQTRNIRTLERGASLVQFIRNIQSTYEHGEEFRIVVSDWEQTLRIFDQITNLPKQLVYFALITFASTVVVSFLMIPHPICIFWLALSSACIIIGTVAGMVLWGISLDPVSLIYLLMAIGATSDYICHSIYTFTVIEPEGNDVKWERLRYAKARRLIAYVVYETVPAVIGTLLSIVVLSTTHVYVLEAFFKVFLISVLVAFVFMTVVLPAALCQFGPTGRTCSAARDDEEQNISGRQQRKRKIKEQETEHGIAEEQTNESTNNYRGIVRTEIVLTNSVVSSSRLSNGSKHHHRRLSVRTPPECEGNNAAAITIDPHDNSKFRRGTWKAKVLDRFLNDSKKYCKKSSRNLSVDSEHRIGKATDLTYENVATVLGKSKKHVGKNRSQSCQRSVQRSDPPISPSTKDHHDEELNNVNNNFHRSNRRQSKTKQPVVQATNKNNHSVLFLSSKHMNEENIRRHGVRRGVLNQ